MKKFTLKLDGSVYHVKGKSVEECFKGKIPALWLENSDKIEESDISKEIENSLNKELDRKATSDYIKANLNVLVDLIKQKKGE